MVMRTFLVALVFLSAPLAAAPARAAQSSPRVSVLPFDGDMGPALRDDIVRVLRARGFSTVTSIPRTDGTAPYLRRPREHNWPAFVPADVEAHGGRRSIPFLVGNGATASVVGRWSAASGQKQIRRTVARGFWKHLAKALAAAQAPPR